MPRGEALLLHFVGYVPRYTPTWRITLHQLQHYLFSTGNPDDKIRLTLLGYHASPKQGDSPESFSHTSSLGNWADLPVKIIRLLDFLPSRTVVSGLRCRAARGNPSGYL